MDYTTLTDSELREIFHAATEETSRRNLITAALQREPILQTRYLAALGRADGEEYVPPTGHHDAYPEGWTVQHDGKTWVSLTAANVWEPGVSGWREIPSEGNTPNWQQPTGAHDAYKAGDTVAHNGATRTSDINSNTWEPGVYGWTKN